MSGRFHGQGDANAVAEVRAGWRGSKNTPPKFSSTRPSEVCPSSRSCTVAATGSTNKS